MNQDTFNTQLHQDDVRMIAQSKKDRNLGDQWASWNGDIANYEWDIHEGRRLFLILSTVVLLVFCSMIAGLWYLIYPRVVEFGSAVVLITNITAGGLIALSLLWFALMFLSVITEKNFLKIMGSKVPQSGIMAFFPLTTKLAAKCGISRDRLGHSFIKVSNALIKIRARIVNHDKLLVLLPRCLTKATFQAVKALG